MSLAVIACNSFATSGIPEAKIEFDTALLLIGETLALYEACPSTLLAAVTALGRNTISN